MGYKIMVLVIIGIIGMVSLGLSSYQGMSKASDDLDNMYSRKLQATRLLGTEISLMRAVKVSTVEYILEPGDAKVEESIDVNIQKYESYWSEYRSLGMRADKAAAEIPNTEAKWNEFKQGVQEVRRLVKEGKKEEAWKYFRKVELTTAEDLLKSQQALRKIADDNADILNTEIKESNTRHIEFSFMVNLVALALLVGLATIIIRDITGALHRGVAICEAMKKGDFRTDGVNHVDRGDELGAMANALFAMRKELNALMRSVSESSEQLAASSEELTASSNQAAQASTQVAQSASDVVNSVEDQQKAVVKSNESVERVQQAVSHVKSQSAKVADNSASAARRAADGSVAIGESVEQIRSVEKTVNGSAEVVDRLIKDIQRDTEDGVDSMRNGREAVVAGARSVEGLRSMFDEINGLVNGVSQQIHTVDEAVEAMAAESKAITTEVANIRKPWQNSNSNNF